ncbi:MAG: hypothetical protein FJX62_20370 [Alphaproteobacteria bacterium]|nr:hypothetical protein [Alphaproteobacteria bacterium]
MHIELTLEHTNVVHYKRILIRKLYHVVFLSSDLRQVDLYSCIVFGAHPTDRIIAAPAEESATDISIDFATSIDAASASSTPTFTSKLSEFRSEPEPWQLMWGRHSFVDAAVSNTNRYSEALDRVRRGLTTREARQSHLSFLFNTNGILGFIPEKVAQFCDACLEQKAIILEGDADEDVLRNLSFCVPSSQQEVIRPGRVVCSMSRTQGLGKLGIVDVISWNRISFPNVSWPKGIRQRKLRITLNFSNRSDLKEDESGVKTAISFDDVKFYIVVPRDWTPNSDRAILQSELVVSTDLQPRRNPIDQMVRDDRAYFEEWKRDFRIGEAVVYRLRGKPLELLGEIPYKKITFETDLEVSAFTHSEFFAGLAVPVVVAFGLDGHRLAELRKYSSHIVETCQALKTPCDSRISLLGRR